MEVHRYFFNRGSKSRNKVAVGEPAAGSFSDDFFQHTQKKPSFGVRAARILKYNKNIFIFCRSNARTNCVRLEHGFHNVSRWMTWLPISLKNAAKCDKWYQLQNHSITESLNANGAREKPSTGLTRACRNLSVEQKPKNTEESWLVGKKIRIYIFLFSAIRWLPRVSASNRRFMGN